MRGLRVFSATLTALAVAACGGGGGGFSTLTCVEAFAVRPRESVQVALMVTGPAEAPGVVPDWAPTLLPMRAPAFG